MRTSSAWHRRSLNWVKSAKEKVGKIKVWMMRCVIRSSNVEKCITVIRGVRNSRKMLLDLLTKTKSFQHNLKCRLYLTIGYFANNILLQADIKVGNLNNPTPQTRETLRRRCWRGLKTYQRIYSLTKVILIYLVVIAILSTRRTPTRIRWSIMRLYLVKQVKLTIYSILVKTS